MIELIQGQIKELNPTNLLMMVNGIGYRVEIPVKVYDDIYSRYGDSYAAFDKVSLYTHFVVKETAQQLYGFSTPRQRKVFRLLLSVNGIGANTARLLLSKFGDDELLCAIRDNNVVKIKSAKGIGPKTAQRIILDLKDKLKEFGDLSGSEEEVVDSGVEQDAILGLVGLGYTKKEATAKVAKVKYVGDNVSELIAKALGS